MNLVSIYKQEFKIIHFSLLQSNMVYVKDTIGEGKTDIKQW